MQLHSDWLKAVMWIATSNQSNLFQSRVDMLHQIWLLYRLLIYCKIKSAKSWEEMREKTSRKHKNIFCLTSQFFILYLYYCIIHKDRKRCLWLAKYRKYRLYYTHREKIFGCFSFAKLGCFVKQNKYFYFFTSQNLCAVAADLLYKSVLGLCLIISRAARYLPKLALNNSPSLCVHFNLYDIKSFQNLSKDRPWRSLYIHRESLLLGMQLHAVDKIKPVFIKCRFNISWLRKAVFNKNIFVLFKNTLTLYQPKVFNLSTDFFIMISLCVYYDLYGITSVKPRRKS